MSEFVPNTDVSIHAIGGYVGWKMPEDSHVGNYHLHQIIGEGSFGTVYLSDVEGEKGKFAVKVSKANFPEIYEREGRLHAKVIDSSHVIPLIEYGSGNADLGPLQYLVTPYRTGGSLKEHIRYGALPLGKVMLFTQQLAEGVDSIHQRGVHHGDMKPHNAFFTSEARDNLEIGDFGSARIYDTTHLAPYDPHHTIAYAAPEIQRRSSIGPTADVFSLALITAEMLRGKKLFDQKEKRLIDTLRDPERYERYLKSRMRKLSYRGRGAFVGPVRKALDWYPDNRYEKAVVFSDDITARYNELLTARPDRGRVYFDTMRRVRQVIQR